METVELTFSNLNTMVRSSRSIMSKKFRCGRLVETHNGTIRKLELSQGGGCRDFQFDSLDMDFDYIRDRLISLFDLDPNDSGSYSLYDFQLRPLDLNRYGTFLEYIQRNGLKFNNTLLYLCNRNSDSTKKKKKATKTTTTTTAATPTVAPVERPEKSSSEVVKIEDDKIEEESPPETKMVVASIDTSRISSPSSSFSIYSYQKGSIDLVDRVRYAMDQPNSYRAIFLRLFEYVCTICSRTSSTLDEMREQIHHINHHHHHPLLPYDQRMLSDTLNDVEDTCRLVRTWIETYRDQIIQVNSFPDFMETFVRFNENLKILRKQWVEYLKNRSEQQERQVRLLPLMSLSLSSSPPIKPKCHRRETTKRERKSSTSRSTTGRRKSKIPKRTKAKSEKQMFNDEKQDFPRRLSSALNDLSNISRHERSMYLYGAAKSAVDELQSRLSNIRFGDYASLCEGEKSVDAVRTRLSRIATDRINNSSRPEISGKQKRAFVKIQCLLRSITFTIHRAVWQASPEQRGPRRPSRSSAPPPLPIENRSPFKSPNSRIVFGEEDDEKSSIASGSSIDDGTLLETATKAFEQLPKRKF